MPVPIAMTIALRIHRHRRANAVFKKEFSARLRRGTDFVHCRGFVEATVEHDVGEFVGGTNILEHVAVDDDKVREFADFERTDVFIHTEIFRAVQCRDPNRFQRRHATKRQGPHFPVRTEALALPVRADVHGDTRTLQLGGGAGDRDDIEVFIRRGEPADAARFQSQSIQPPTT